MPTKSRNWRSILLRTAIGVVLFVAGIWFIPHRWCARDSMPWYDDPLDSLDGDSDHAAFLGYFNMVLSLHRLIDPQSKHAALNDRITAALVRRIDRSPTLLLQTYPSEVYPVDNCAVIASIGLHDRATGADHGELVRRWMRQCRGGYIDRKTGLLYQCVDPQTGAAVDHPRGSGSCLGLYFLSFADPVLARELHGAVGRHLAGAVLGFGVVREYPRAVRDGRGDIDSGPIILGYGIAATGFSIAGTRMYGEPSRFADLYGTAYLFGAPRDSGGTRNYVTGGPLGNAILFAMLTALREDQLHR